MTTNVKRTIYLAAALLFCNMNVGAQTFMENEGDTTVITEYNDGRLWAYREIGDFVVGITNCETKDDYGRYYKIEIFIHNRGFEPVTFNPEEVSSRLITNAGDTLQMLVYTNEKYQKKIKRSQAWAMILYGFSSGLNTATAGHSTSYSTSYSPNGYAYTTITHHYDANAASQARLAASYQMMTLGRSMENDRQIKEQGYLKKTTVHPGESIVGYMNIKRKKGHVLTVDVPVNGQVYSFDWDVRRNKK